MTNLTCGLIRAGATLTAALTVFMLSLCVTSASHAQAFRACVMVSGTDDGVALETAVAGSREALENAIVDWRRQNPGLNPVRSAARPKPNPYWRDSVSPDLYFKPDIVDPGTYTICWRGVVSPVVCTSGARLCY